MVLAASRARRSRTRRPPPLQRRGGDGDSRRPPDAEGLHHPGHAPNAFATGRDPEHASVAVTSGLLDKLDRDELQGVIAHEMAHVGNYDIRYAMLVGILVGTTVLISDFFLRGLWFGGGREG
jgi:heat shock protein HtpX